MKKALVFYLWGRKNAGDMAISMGAASLLIEKGYDVTFISKFTENQSDFIDSKQYIESYFKQVTVEPGIFELDREKSFMQMCKYYLNGIKKIMIPSKNKKLANYIKEFDLICLNGGNLLRGEKLVDYARLVALFYPFVVGKQSNKRMIILPQSTAENSFIGTEIIKRSLKNFDLVCVRENISYEKLKEKMGNVNFFKTTDLAFYIKDSVLATKKFNKKYEATIKKNEENIAIVLRGTTIGDLGNLNNSQRQEIATNIINYVTKCSDQQNIFFVVQTLKDQEFTKYVINRIKREKQPIMIVENDTMVLREIYKNMEYVVAMRLHASILAMSSKTPVIGYFNKNWGGKNQGIMEEIGMPWTYDGQKLIELTERIVKKEEAYKGNIENFITHEKSEIRKKI
ncbi:MULTISPECIES: polysaccharide pyruvyl transferase family protein [Tetragenococcus]|uniref:polysaccharide pyruvyl transferase family protein n=1 Tax=Tetragenococcus TaxID=51668 RepID=UPI001F166346|nr:MULTISPECIES: polysaccharide pyruvyl transferase family protein [Tetragenococcus]MCF1680002.1 polysaccharide pyruvyl transferase family protein [Tetragenococcus koreensis]MCF1687434.1 polysaccharide pyruvyl transferase family protein [Tetragenococcus koreensis]MCO8288800.1 polysaccharide pyruvyl transferase family protein [Tetragenococcus halophilus]MDN6839747.1 polysaccharide pyruvyl transferase family protein [Tetragenococcus halophilus]